MSMIVWLITDGWQWLLGLAGVIGGLVLWNNRKAQGVAEARSDQEKMDAAAKRLVEEAQDDVSHLDADARRERLRQQSAKHRRPL